MNATPRDVYTNSVFAFVERCIAATPAEPRILEVGCGKGDLSLRLKTAGYDILGLDKSLAEIEDTTAKGVPAVHGDFLSYVDGPFDAVLFTMSLHHMEPLAEVLDHAGRLVKPGGLLLIEDFDYQRVDQATLHWYDGVKKMLVSAGLCGHDQDEDHPSPGSDVLEQWHQHHAHEHRLNTGRQMIEAISDRFHILESQPGSYFYRYFCYRMDPNQRATRVAEILRDQENQLRAESLLLSTGLRIAARKPVS